MDWVRILNLGTLNTRFLLYWLPSVNGGVISWFRMDHISTIEIWRIMGNASSIWDQVYFIYVKFSSSCFWPVGFYRVRLFASVLSVFVVHPVIWIDGLLICGWYESFSTIWDTWAAHICFVHRLCHCLLSTKISIQYWQYCIYFFMHYLNSFSCSFIFSAELKCLLSRIFS